MKMKLILYVIMSTVFFTACSHFNTADQQSLSPRQPQSSSETGHVVKASSALLITKGGVFHWPTINGIEVRAAESTGKYVYSSENPIQLREGVHPEFATVRAQATKLCKMLLNDTAAVALGETVLRALYVNNKMFNLNTGAEIASFESKNPFSEKPPRLQFASVICTATESQ